MGVLYAALQGRPDKTPVKMRIARVTPFGPGFTLFGTIRRGGSALQSKSIAAESAGRRQLLSRN